MYESGFRHIVWLLCLFCSQLCVAQHNHTGEEAKEEKPERMWIKDAQAKHGGELVNAGKYKLEVVCTPFHTGEKISVYLLRGKKVIGLNQASGEVFLKYKNGSQERRRLEVLNERMVLDSLDVSQPVNIEFKISVNNKLVTAIYYYQGLK